METLDPVRPPDQLDRPSPEPASGPPVYVLLPLFAVAAFLMTFRSFGDFDSHIIGNSGDPLLILWILGWVQHAIPHGWGEIWNTSMFFPVQNTLAFSDSMLSAAIVEWPLRAILGRTLGFNVLAVAAQTASLWFMYRLALRLTRCWPAAGVAALAFTFSTPLLAHLAHYQLTLTAFLVPLTMLLLVRYLEHWRLRFAVGVGLALAALTTSATYYGLMIACAVPVVVVGYLLWYRPTQTWRFVRGLVVGALLAAVITLPVAVQYVQLQDDPYFRRGFDATVAAHPSDFLAPAQENYFLTDVLPFENYAFDRSIENRLFPGMVATVFGIVGVAVLVLGARRRRSDADDTVGLDPVGKPGPPAVDDRWRSRIALLIAAGGLVAVVMAFGDEVTIGGFDVPMPFKVMRRFVPGFSGIRATSRFALMGVCGLSLCAAFGVRELLRRMRGPIVAGIVTLVLAGIVIAETLVSIPLVRVPDGRVADAVATFLDDRPPGVVAELPILGLAEGPLWAYLESPRQLVSLGNGGHDRVNGYSGYAPEGFDAIVSRLNTFPGPKALRALRNHDVRYVVLRTRVLGDQLPDIRAVLERDGVGRYTPASARARIERIPPDLVRRVTRVPGAYVVELRR